ncbi:hypothetical protein PRZ48_001961 [Zasmidium cellare]|uniref:SnoaL-like domain-containing protein n=1 Tax=Zasmidium cellare TaxID=395010 RepID=A0ABR0F5A5_ZASCE|nr:hypothetical protein PRZ48_001961 [Zasmidium cellare]
MAPSREDPFAVSMAAGKTKSKNKSATATYLETMVRAWENALDRRLLDPDHPIWRGVIDPSFTVIPTHPYDPIPLDFSQFMAHLRNMIASSEDSYRLKIHDMDTDVNEEAGTATVFMNLEVSGLPLGVTKPSVAVFRFRKGRDGNWRVTTYEAAEGIESAAGAAPT